MPQDYSWSQRNKDFLKAKFKYGVKLRQKLADGSITQEYYDKNIALASQDLENPRTGFIKEFIQAVDEMDINWLANEVKEDAGALAAWLGTTTGKIVGGVAGGLASGLGFPGWVLLLIAAGLGYWAFTSGPLSTFKVRR